MSTQTTQTTQNTLSTLIPAELLQKSDKILFIAHLALGDFTYLQNFFRGFAAQHPHMKIHLWVDEVRRTADASQWPHLKKYSLYDWTAACPFFAKVYTQTYSPELYRASIAEARREHYPIVVSLATLRPHLYAGLAREISPEGWVVGMKNRSSCSSRITCWPTASSMRPCRPITAPRPSTTSAMSMPTGSGN